MKITSEILQKPNQYSFEYYPPREDKLLDDFYPRIFRMSLHKPAFIDVTWGTGLASGLKSLEISQHIQDTTGIPTMLHLTCTDRSKSELLEILHQIKNSHIKNIMALRGNKPRNASWNPHPEGFQYAYQLVEFIRHHFDDTFTISVAAYPEGHWETMPVNIESDYYTSQKYQQELIHLKQKCDTGADFIVTQLCFDLQRIKEFKKQCQNIGITQPIIPGILPIHSFKIFNRIAEFSASIPEELAQQIHKIPPDSVEHLQQFASQLLNDQLNSLHADGFNIVHLYTLNFEKVINKTLKNTNN